MQVLIRRVTSADKKEWFKMRHGIWPDAPLDYLDFDMDDILQSERDAVFIAEADGVPAGMIESRIREYGEGCETSPVGYIEAWFVYETFRGSGVSGKLMEAAEEWARQKGCTEMGSDTWLDNELSIGAHLKFGYVEAERLVHFVKPL